MTAVSTPTIVHRERLREQAGEEVHAPSSGVSLKLAYLTTEYPKVSHTFIRREILELERRGHTVHRLAIRDNGGAVADDRDVDEARKTFVCLNQPPIRLAMLTVLAALTRPVRFIDALRCTWRMGRSSERGLIRHLAYLVEACTLLPPVLAAGVQHLHVHFGTNAAAVARLIRRLGGPSWSMTVHGPDEFDAPRSFDLAGKVGDAAFTIAISDFCAAQLRRWSDPSAWNRIHVVHCCVGEEFLTQAPPTNEASRTLVCVGRLNAQKGHQLLLEAAARLCAKGIEFSLMLAGDGELRTDLEQSIRTLNLAGTVRITGWVDGATVRSLILSSRALVQPSFAEGLPVVMMEALALERPVIATTIAGVPELVRHGENGWLVPAGNVDELVEAMRDALSADGDRLARMGRAGRERVLDHHRPAVEVARLEALLINTVAESGADALKGGR